MDYWLNQLTGFNMHDDDDDYDDDDDGGQTHK